MKRTTIMADEALLLEAQQLAAQRGTTFTTLVDAALREYIETHRRPRRFAFVGLGRSGEPGFDVSDGRDEALLAAAIDPVGGWSPPDGRDTASEPPSDTADSR